MRQQVTPKREANLCRPVGFVNGRIELELRPDARVTAPVCRARLLQCNRDLGGGGTPSRLVVAPAAISVLGSGFAGPSTSSSGNPDKHFFWVPAAGTSA